MSLKEIARLSGTSISTVSRVLNQPDYHCQNPELKNASGRSPEKCIMYRIPLPNI